MCQFDVPIQLVYLQLLTIFFCLFSAFFIFLNSRKNQANFSIETLILITGLWAFLNMLQWIVHDSFLNMFFGQLAMLLVFMVLFFLYFTYHFTGQEISLRKKIILAVPFLPILVFLFGKYNMIVVNASDCTFTNGPLYSYAYLLATIYTIWAIVVLIRKHREETTPPNLKFQIKILISDIAFLVLWMIFFFVRGNQANLKGIDIEAEVSSFLILGVMFFIAVIVYAIYKGALFQISRLSKNIFVGVLWAILFLIIFVIQPGTAFSIVAFLLYLFLITIFWIL